MRRSGKFWRVKTAPMAKVQLCEYEDQTLEAFVTASRSSAKFDYPVARHNVSLLDTGHGCETSLLMHYMVRTVWKSP